MERQRRLHYHSSLLKIMMYYRSRSEHQLGRRACGKGGEVRSGYVSELNMDKRRELFGFTEYLSSQSAPEISRSSVKLLIGWVRVSLRSK